VPVEVKALRRFSWHRINPNHTPIICSFNGESNSSIPQFNACGFLMAPIPAAPYSAEVLYPGIVQFPKSFLCARSMAASTLQRFNASTDLIAALRARLFHTRDRPKSSGFEGALAP